MSTINVTNLSGRNGSPNLPDGAVVTGVVTSTTFDGNLKSTGTPTLGLGVTINSSGLVVSGVATAGILSATTLYGDGSSLTGVGESIAPWHYNPDINDQEVPVNTGIGITFNKKVEAGSGTATIKIVNAGVAGTTVQSWGISSATIGITDITLGALVTPLTVNETYQLDIPEGFIVSSTGTNYAGTAYTFSIQDPVNKIWAIGYNADGELAQNNRTEYSSPVQIPGTTWKPSGWTASNMTYETKTMGAVKTDGTLWTWGSNQHGALGTNQADGLKVSSPVQVPGTTWSTVSISYYAMMATKTDGTAWSWGYNGQGMTGLNITAQRSSPCQIPGTTWSKMTGGRQNGGGIKTDGTLWVWGNDDRGQLGQNSQGTKRSSPIQIPGTTWKQLVYNTFESFIANKTDGTLWAWGRNMDGCLGLNDQVYRSSPTQVPGTTWANLAAGGQHTRAGKTDGTLWGWGKNNHGQLGQNNTTNCSSPIQIPGTTWGTGELDLACSTYGTAAIKTDGTLWTWGYNAAGEGGQNDTASRSSPIQVGSLTEWTDVVGQNKRFFMNQLDQTP
tara:strand:+ start:3 stop:1676 length:1674 start_codon:yes stop_codon:yes gene_type:complete